MTLGFGKKTRRNYHHILLKGQYPIPLQNPLSGKSNCQYVGSNNDLPAAGMRTQDLWCMRVAARLKTLLQSQSKQSIAEGTGDGLSMGETPKRGEYGRIQIA